MELTGSQKTPYERIGLTTPVCASPRQFRGEFIPATDRVNLLKDDGDRPSDGFQFLKQQSLRLMLPIQTADTV